MAHPLLLERQYKAFRSRIVAPLVMQPMTDEETAAMIEFRLDGWGLENPFSTEVMTRIHALSGGVPRDTLSLCQQAYDLADDACRHLVLPDDVEQAFRLLQIVDPEPALEAAV